MERKAAERREVMKQKEAERKRDKGRARSRSRGEATEKTLGLLLL